MAPRDPSALAVSSLLLVDHAEAVPAEQKDPTNPLYFGTTLIYPNLGTPVTRSKRGSLVFFYTARAAGRPLTGRVELLQDQRVVASREMPVPPRTRPASSSTPTSCRSTSRRRATSCA